MKSKLMDVGDIVQEYLEANGYDGLCQEEGECACELGDLAPCGQIEMGCIAGHKVPCTGGGDYQNDPPNCEGQCAWHMAKGKRPIESIREEE